MQILPHHEHGPPACLLQQVRHQHFLRALLLPLRTQDEGVIALCRERQRQQRGQQGDRFLEGDAIALQRLFQLREF